MKPYALISPGLVLEMTSCLTTDGLRLHRVIPSRQMDVAGHEGEIMIGICTGCAHTVFAQNQDILSEDGQDLLRYLPLDDQHLWFTLPGTTSTHTIDEYPF